MSPELIAIIAAAIALAGVILPGQWAMRRDIGGLRNDMAQVRERLARLEGAVEVLTRNVDTLTRHMLDRERPAAGE